MVELMHMPEKEYDFKRIESNSSNLWKKIGLKERILSSKRKKTYSFLEGPPTANAPPALHHVEVRVFKDLFCRFKYMQGYSVPRKGGWDCHGLPVEVQVEKQLGLNSKKEVLAYGIDKFTADCRKDVFKYIGNWNIFTEKMAYMTDLEHPYRTLDNDYIESEWWSLKELYNKGLLFVDYKVVPYCPRCGTPLSSHEVALGYEDVTENTITCRFRVKTKDANKKEYFLAWTTTPWTLPSNLALAVNKKIEYAFVEHEFSTYILAKALVPKYFEDAKITKTVLGEELLGMEYEPLFPYYTEKFRECNEKAFIVIPAEYVSTEDGTGIVHQAPAFGEDDFVSCRAFGIGFVNPVGEDGKFTSEIPELSGTFVKDADKKIVSMLENNEKLFKVERYTHSYPFCWRCNTPLLYYARQSWFVKVSAFREKLLEKNQEINWYPEHIKFGRFGNWLEGAKDWALSRSKFWGTPLPIWKCPSCASEIAIGSIAELKEKGINAPENIELHKPYIDEIKIKCKCGEEMSRVPDVIDCWYDSGSASFAQFHYPFENKEEFEKRFPYDFIAEATDQTRGWFYTLHVLGVLLFDSPAYKSVVCAGLLVDENGEKMSKSKGNIINPEEAFEKVGVDAIRLQMCSTAPGVIKRFSYNLVRESSLSFLKTLWNTYYFTAESMHGISATEFLKVFENLKSEKSEERKKAVDFAKKLNLATEDRWIISRANSTAEEFTKALEKHDYNICTKLLSDFLGDDFSRWYIKIIRNRAGKKDSALAFSMLYSFDTAARLLAPFAPYTAEEIYQGLLNGATSRSESIHEEPWPAPEKELTDKNLETEMENARKVVTSILSLRDKKNIGVRWPIRKAIVVSKNPEMKRSISAMLSIIRQQVNVREIDCLAETRLVRTAMKPDYSKLGPAFAKKTPKVIAVLSKEKADAILSCIEKEGEFRINIDGEEIAIKPEHIVIEHIAEEPYLLDCNEGLSVLLDPRMDEELISEGYIRELTRRIQDLRKTSGFQKADRIILAVESEETAAKLLDKKELVEKLKSGTGAAEAKISAGKEAKGEFTCSEKIKDHEFFIGISKK
jgi:isoleucyl-tRNA synthetase